MADLGPDDAALPSLRDQFVLCTIRVRCLQYFGSLMILNTSPQLNSKGVLEVRPNFNSERLPYRIETRQHDIYEYVLEHCSSPIADESRIKDELLQRGL